ncbi:MAG: carboxylating nicotinate-nucleotide diphosphorylase [Gammaproteobacteria bacterium]
MHAHDSTNISNISESVRIALTEDIGQGDVSAALCDPHNVIAKVICRETATLCGQAWFDETFNQLDSSVSVNWLRTDGDIMHPGNDVCQISGPARSILSGERTALNFLQTLSGTATATKKLLHRLKGSDTKLLDTRKTIPGLRYAQKYAVLCAGGNNHRMGLYDAYLIKENHIAACGSISNAIARAKQQNPELKIEVEVETLDQLKQAIDHHADTALLDNFSLQEVKLAVEISNKKINLEVSGNITMDNINQYAMLGVDYISVGAITKHVQSVDFSMLFNDQD